MTARVDADELAAEWLAKSTQPVGDRHCRLDDAASDDPESAWSAILKVIEHPLTDEQTAYLAAGPPEILLSKHGAAFIDRVEHEARVNPKFSFLLGGVWKHGMSDDVWNRVQRARSAVW
jgi:hypothetical protein